jgi:hypothetical protein
MDEEAHAGDDQQHDERKLVEGEGEVDVKAGKVKPREGEGFDGGEKRGI